MRSLALLAWVVAVSSLPGLADSPPARIYLADEEQPPVLEQVGAPEGLTTLTIDSSGELAAAAQLYGVKNRESTILLYSTAAAEPTRVRVAGVIRDLLFAPDGASVYGLLHRPAKKREGDTHLIRVDLATAKSKRLAYLPPSARALDYGRDSGRLLLAVRNEIRTLTLPDLRSGPLYRVPGENLAVSALGRDGMILVGQTTALLLIDLDDLPGEHEMPVRERLEIPQPVLSLASSRSGERVLARLADGTIWSVSFSPLRGEPVGAAMAVAAAKAPPAAHEPIEAAQPPEPPAVVVAEAAAVEEVHVVEDEPPVLAPSPGELEASTATAPPPPATSDEPQVRGKISGPALAAVEAIVLLGPDNILREERRVAPRPDGTWQVDGLPPGRYRVQLDAGGERVLVTEPAFILLEVKVGESLSAQEIKALEAL